MHQSLLQQSTPTTRCCHPHASGLDGVLQLASLPFFPNITMVVMAKQFYFCFIRPEDISPKSTRFNPHVQLQTVVWLFYGGFGAVASSLLSGLSGYVDIGLVLLWICNVVLRLLKESRTEMQRDGYSCLK